MALKSLGLSDTPHHTRPSMYLDVNYWDHIPQLELTISGTVNGRSYGSKSWMVRTDDIKPAIEKLVEFIGGRVEWNPK